MGGPGPHRGSEEGSSLAWAGSSMGRATVAADPQFLCGARTGIRSTATPGLVRAGTEAYFKLLNFSEASDPEIALLLNVSIYMKKMQPQLQLPLVTL